VAIREHGLRVAVSELGPFKVKLPAYASLDEAPDAQALLLTFKAHQWRDVLAQIARAVARGAFIVQPAI
jgi:ketopantoate reductase